MDIELKNQQSESGVDLTQLRENLSLTPLERLRKLERNVKAIKALKQKMKKVQENEL